jgi:uncharacterized HAD superfamily protein/adenine/guanine phosphoribosyltransferase-like PRPP-binding protein
MQYRTLSDLKSTILRGTTKLPSDVDLIVGIPRSGLLAANLLALHLNLPLTDVAGLLEGRVLGSGKRGRFGRDLLPVDARRILVLDDSLHTGAAMSAVRAVIANSVLADRVVYAAVFVAPGAEPAVDIAFETCSLPRFFEWNFMHHSALRKACVDIDGVLCRDPLADENDDGPRYREFLSTVPPLHVPTMLIGTIVTCRLEKYRAETSEWLARFGVAYRELVMLDLPSKEERIRLGSHARFKAEVYRARSSQIFIESSVKQALAIADLARKPVFCVESSSIVFPSPRSLTTALLRRVPRAIARRATFATSTLGTWILKRAGY